MNINIKKLNPSAITPKYAHEGDAGADLFSIERVVVPVGAIRIVHTGISIEIPLGYEGQIRPRSGMAAKWGVTVINSPGTIDSGYKGELMVALINHGGNDYLVEPGNRVAQLVIAPVVCAKFMETATEDAGSCRGSNGFGSSGS